MTFLVGYPIYERATAFSLVASLAVSLFSAPFVGCYAIGPMQTLRVQAHAPHGFGYAEWSGNSAACRQI